MQSPAHQVEPAKADLRKGSLRGIARRLFTRRAARQVALPLALVSLIALVTAPLWNDLCELNQGGLMLVEHESTAGNQDGRLLVLIKSINPNNGLATLDVTYVTEKLDDGRFELWIASGSVAFRGGKLCYEKTTELRRIPVVMDSPTVFHLGETKRATYKQQNAEIRIDQRTQGHFCPFDSYVIELSFVLTDQSGRALHPKLWCELHDSQFLNAMPQPLVSHGEKAFAIPNSLMMTLKRPMYVKIFLAVSLLMGLGCVLWTLYKVAFTPITGMESFSLLAFDFTVLMAVPALRGAFVPANLQFAPLFDFFVVLIWTAGLLTLVVSIFRHDFLVRSRQTSSGGSNSSPVLPFTDRRDPAKQSQSIMSRRAAS